MPELPVMAAGRTPMNWFAIGAGGTMILNAVFNLWSGRLGRPAAGTLAAVGALFVALGANWL